MPPEIIAKFVIFGTTVTPDEITSAIGINPTQTWLIGDQIQTSAIRRKHNGWRLSTGYLQDFDLEKYGRQLLEILLPKAEIITTFCRENKLECELGFTAFIIEETPIANFSEQFIADLAKLNASLDIDIMLTTE